MSKFKVIASYENGFNRFKFTTNDLNNYILNSIRIGLSTRQMVVKLQFDDSKLSFSEKVNNNQAEVGISLIKEIERLHLDFDPFDKNINKTLSAITAEVELVNDTKEIMPIYTTDIKFSDGKNHLIYGSEKYEIGFLLPSLQIRYEFSLTRVLKSSDGSVINFLASVFYDDDISEQDVTLAFKRFNPKLNYTKYISNIYDEVICPYVDSVLMKLELYKKNGSSLDLNVVESEIIKTYTFINDDEFLFSIFQALMRFHYIMNSNETQPLINIVQNHKQGLIKFVKVEVKAKVSYIDVFIDILRHFKDISAKIINSLKFP